MIDYKLFDTFQDAVLVLDDEGKVVYGNVAATFLLDVSAKRLGSGKPLAQYMEFEPKLFDSLSSVTEATQLREVAFTAASGKVGWIQVVVQPQPEFYAATSTEENEKRRWILALRDVSLEKTLHDKYRGELDKKESVINDLKAARSALEDYSKNLELKVQERTVELTKTNGLLRTILDSLGQGILVFGSDGLTLPVYSQICEKLFGDTLAGRKIEDVLGLSVGDQSTFANWRETVFQEMLDFDDLTPLAPDRLPLPPPVEIGLSYNRVVSEGGTTSGVVVVATDRTAEMEALKVASRERALVRKIVQVARHREAFKMFVNDAADLLTDLSLKGSSKAPIDREELERRLHTLKGGAATFALDALAHVCHELESQLKTAETESPEFRTHLSANAAEMKTILDAELVSLSDLLGSIHREAQSTGADTEEPSIEVYLRPLESSVAELAERLGKRLAPIHMAGVDVRVSSKRFQRLFSSFVHAFRNAVDHGLEAPAQRLAAGKSPEGHLSFTCSVSEGELQIEISDDGQGVNVEKIREKLRTSPLRASLADGTDAEVAQVILEGDLSTAEKVTEVSGRGVGLSAVAAEARKLGGTIRVESVFGQGTRIVMRVPVEASTERILKSA